MDFFNNIKVKTKLLVLTIVTIIGISLVGFTGNKGIDSCSVALHDKIAISSWATSSY